jgi:hypothetical protein
MIPQTFQALMMAQVPQGGGEGSGTALVIFDFETFSPTTLQNVQTASDYTISWTSGQVYPSTVEAEYGVRSLLFITQEAAISPSSQLPADTFTDFTVEFSFYFDAAGAATLLMAINRFAASAGEVYITITETFTGSGIWALTISQDSGSTLVLSVESAFVLDTWVKLAFVVNKGLNEVAIYAAGTKIATTDANLYSGTPYTLDTLVFGQGGALFSSGSYIDNFRFSKGARYINATYTLPVGPFTPD